MHACARTHTHTHTHRDTHTRTHTHTHTHPTMLLRPRAWRHQPDWRSIVLLPTQTHSSSSGFHPARHQSSGESKTSRSDASPSATSTGCAPDSHTLNLANAGSWRARDGSLENASSEIGTQRAHCQRTVFVGTSGTGLQEGKSLLQLQHICGHTCRTPSIFTAHLSQSALYNAAWRPGIARPHSSNTSTNNLLGSQQL